MTASTSSSNFDTFRALHHGGLLRLANAWDPGSARLIESLGAKAIATTSAGVAWAAGYRDGDQMPPDVVLSISERIARVVTLPLSVDIEGGYSPEPAQVADLVVRLADKGVVGINLEDGREPANLLARKIDAIKAALARAGLSLFVNARTDVYLAQLVEKPLRIGEVLARSRLYEAAGADGLFVPAITDLAEIRVVSGGSGLPLNVLAWEGLAAPDQLEAAGVRRLSAGSGIATRVWAQAGQGVQRFLQSGVLAGDAMPYAELQGLFG